MTVLLAPAPALGDWRDLCPPLPAERASVVERTAAIDTLDGQIAGTITIPAEGVPTALVLMLHGYTGARNEIPVAGGEGMFVRTARAFAEGGIASLRIDFIGSGQSDGDWADTRFSGQARDAIRAARWFDGAHGAEDRPLGVLGYSQGGLVALRVAASSDVFDKIALWNPVMDPMATYGIIFGEETITEAAERADQDGPNDIVADTRLRPGFFSEIVAADPIADAARSEAPILVVTGRRDPLVTDGAALAGRIAAGRSAQTVVVDLDAGHDLGAVNAPELLDEVIHCTATFLRR